MLNAEDSDAKISVTVLAGKGRWSDTLLYKSTELWDMGEVSSDLPVEKRCGQSRLDLESDM